MPSESYHAVTHCIFDMDGLLLDTEIRYEKAIGTVTRRYGKEYPFEVKMKVMGRTGYEAAQVVVNELKLPISVEEYIDEVTIEYDKVFNDVQMMPGAERLVKHLYNHKIPIAIATSSKRATFELKTRNLKHIFNLFDHILVASDDPEITRGKPDPQTFLVAANRFTIKPQDNSYVLVFEDSPMGVQAAMSAGMQCVWVPDPKIDKSIANPTLTLSSLEQFKPELFDLPPF